MAGFDSVKDLLIASFPGVSTRELARRMGIDHSTISRWYTGKAPTMDHCLRVARLCGIEPAAVFDIADRNTEYGELFEYYGGRVPEIAELFPDDPVRAELLNRTSVAIDRSGVEAVQSRLLELERPWVAVEESLADVASESGAEAAFARVRLQGRCVILGWKCRRQEALEVLDGCDAGWQSVLAESQGLSMEVFCRNPAADELPRMREAVSRNVRLLAPLF